MESIFGEPEHPPQLTCFFADPYDLIDAFMRGHMSPDGKQIMVCILGDFLRSINIRVKFITWFQFVDQAGEFDLYDLCAFIRRRLPEFTCSDRLRDYRCRIKDFSERMTTTFEITGITPSVGWEYFGSIIPHVDVPCDKPLYSKTVLSTILSAVKPDTPILDNILNI